MCAYPNQHDRDLGQLSVDWTLEHTDQRSKDFMRALPFDRRFELGGQRVLLVHGSPRKVNEYLFEDKPAKTFERIVAGADCEVMVFGHTHKPWIHTYGDTLFVNCGSVGKPKDGDPRGGFAILEAPADEVTCADRALRLRRRVRRGSGRRSPASPASTPRSCWSRPESLTTSPPSRAACSPSSSAQPSSPPSSSARASRPRISRPPTPASNCSRTLRPRRRGCSRSSSCSARSPEATSTRSSRWSTRASAACAGTKPSPTSRPRWRAASQARSQRMGCSPWRRSASRTSTAPRRPTCSPRSSPRWGCSL